MSAPTPPSVTQEWEAFCDHSFYEMWCVRKVGDRTFGQGFHVMRQEEADALCTLLNTRTTAEAASAARVNDYQARVDAWMGQTFSPEVRADKIERAMRFLEEATELCQAIGLSADKAHTVVDYVFGRPIGEPWQEVGGSMVTLAALCASIGQDMAACGERELARIDTPEMRQKIAAKQVSKRLFGMVGESVEARALLAKHQQGEGA